MRKLQAQYAVPIIDLFYDGTGDPNSLLIPHLSWLVERGRAGHCAQQMLL
jgi:hypothetical protein